jgi:hypothetical protein
VVIRELVDRAARSADCVLHGPAGRPVVPPGLKLPDDLRQFYDLCGGIDLFVGSDYGISIVSPKLLLPTNHVILGKEFPDDITHSWFTIGATLDREYLSIDLAQERCGRSYGSFHEIHGIAGSSPIIANSFAELFERLINSRGGHWFWLDPDFADYGDAYDYG